MDQNTRNQIDWQQPFPHEEYYARQNRVRVALKAHGYTGILISSPPMSWVTLPLTSRYTCMIYTLRYCICWALITKNLPTVFQDGTSV